MNDENGRLTITGLEVTHFAGLREFELAPSQITILAGKNGTGKTSVLAALQAALKARGGIPDDAIHVDHDRAELRVHLSDATEIRRTHTRGKAQQISVRNGNATMSKPAALLDGLLDPVSLDPVAWLNGDREAALLDSMPLELTEAELDALMDRAGIPADDRPEVATAGRHALVVLGEIEASTVKRRGKVNAAIKQIRGWLESEREAFQLLDNPQGELEQVAAEIANIDRQQESAEKLAEQRASATRSVAALTARVDRLGQRCVELREALTQAEADKAEAEAAYECAMEALDATPEPPDVGDLDEQRTILDARQAELRERRGAYEESVRANARLQAEADRLSILEARAKTLNGAVNVLRDAPGEILASANLPVEGLEYTDGQLRRYGVPVSMLSGAETIRLAAQVAIHRVRQQRGQFILMDGLEQLDDEQRAAFLEEARASGVQWICTEVGFRDDESEETEETEGTTVVVMGCEE